MNEDNIVINEDSNGTKLVAETFQLKCKRKMMDSTQNNNNEKKSIVDNSLVSDRALLENPKASDNE